MARALPDGRRVAPSILSADFSRLGDQIREVLDAGARVIHFDVMDGHFVPPITIGPLVLESIAGLVHDAGAWLDVHLMVERPERQVPDFARAGADSINVHFEATPHVHYALKSVREQGCLAGLAINPATPAEAVTAAVDELDILLCMTVNPGWGGQAFIESSTAKVARLRELLPERVCIAVDGGVDTDTVGRLAEAGASLFVAGSAVFGSPDPADSYRRIADAAGAA
ncbi:MAG TPA: ribulose-phosphate 3-epimerase [Thermoleophilaceae bacterium]